MEIGEVFIEQFSRENYTNTKSSNIFDPEAHIGAFARSKIVKH